MTQIPAGWYPDPDPEQTTEGAQRYWDGRQWTEHVHVPAPPQPPAGGYPGQGGWGQPGPQGQQDWQGQQGLAGEGQAQPGPYGGGAGQPMAYPSYGAAPSGPSGQLGSMPGADLAAAGGRDFTPDGQRLAGWWRRFAALLLDSVLTSIVVVIVALPWVRDIAAAYVDLLREATTAAESGAPLPDQGQFIVDLTGPLFVVTLIGLIVNFVYHVGFLKWRAATPGKMVLGMKVRLRETPGPLSWGTVLKRWIGQNWYVAVSAVPLLGAIASLWPLLDGLWPLWDGKRQALHDKVAATNVVRTR